MKNKVAMITGAAVGIGRAVAMLMAQKGAKLVLLDIDAEKLELVKNEVLSLTEVITYQCDVSDECRVRECVNDAITQFGAIDILVNSAAIWKIWNYFIEQDMDAWRKLLEVNLTGTAVATQAVLPGMMERGWGRIVNVASVAGVYGNPKMVAYSATKGAVISFTKALAKEVADHGITVNAVSPGTVSPSNQPDIDHVQPSEFCYMGRTGSDRENAELICFLASEGAAYISGQNIQIDGCRKKI